MSPEHPYVRALERVARFGPRNSGVSNLSNAALLMCAQERRVMELRAQVDAQRAAVRRARQLATSAPTHPCTHIRMPASIRTCIHMHAHV